MTSTATDAGALVERGGVEVLRWKAFEGRPLDAVVTTRHGGVSGGAYATLNLGLHVGDDEDAVVENRRRAARAVGLSLDELVFCNQVHGCEVAVVDEGHRGRGTTSLQGALDGVDALVTATAGLGLVIMVADCVPLVLHDPVAGVVACVHAGWRGTAARVAEAALAAMVPLGARPADVVATVGPAVEADRYQVGDEVADALRDALGPAADGMLRPDGTGRWLCDLWAANRHILVESGLLPTNVVAAPMGTGHPGFFSDRSARPCGRFAAVAALRPSARPPTRPAR